MVSLGCYDTVQHFTGVTVSSLFCLNNGYSNSYFFTNFVIIQIQLKHSLRIIPWTIIIHVGKLVISFNYKSFRMQRVKTAYTGRDVNKALIL